jgi:WD40 repeat protein
MTAGADGTARFWDGAMGTLLQTYRGWPGFLADAILTPDGLVIGGDADGSLRFWDAASGAKLWTLPVQYIWRRETHREDAFEANRPRDAADEQTPTRSGDTNETTREVPAASRNSCLRR